MLGTQFEIPSLTCAWNTSEHQLEGREDEPQEDEDAYVEDDDDMSGFIVSEDEAVDGGASARYMLFWMPIVYMNVGFSCFKF